MSAPAPLVSVIVLSWNSRDFLEGCLSSVLAQSWPSVELIVVDNASTDGSAALVRARFPQANLLENKENLGFCGGNNAGLTLARGVYILFLNADAVLQPDYLEKALARFAADSRTGMVAGKVLRFDRRTLDTTGQMLTRSRRVVERGYGEPDRGQYDEPGDVFSVCGAVALFRRDLIDSVSLDGQFFDEDFFAFGEDIDVGWRARNAGWICRYEPSAVALHYRGGTQASPPGEARRGRQLARRPPAIQAHIVKNRYLGIIKNESPRAFLRDLPFILAWDIAIWGWLIVRAPRAIPLLWGHRRLLGSAFAKRRALQGRVPPRRGATVG